MTLSNRYFFFLSKYCLLICKSCKHAVCLSQVRIHLRGKHHELGPKETATALADIQQKCVRACIRCTRGNALVYFYKKTKLRREERKVKRSKRSLINTRCYVWTNGCEEQPLRFTWTNSCEEQPLRFLIACVSP